MRAVETIKEELAERLKFFYDQGKLVEAQRLEQRTRFDLEMLQELGFCKGIENYSRHMSGARPGEPPPTLVDYLPPDALMFIDESHVTIGQLGGMYRGDRARKETLVDYGFRLPSAMDNRPLKFEEFETQDAPVRVRLGDAVGLRRREGGPGARAGGPAHRAGRSADRGAAGIHARSTTCSRRSAPASRARSGCWSPRSPSAWPRT